MTRALTGRVVKVEREGLRSPRATIRLDPASLGELADYNPSYLVLPLELLPDDISFGSAVRFQALPVPEEVPSA